MGNNIKKIRKSRDLTLKNLAELVNTTAPQIRFLETGERNLTHDWMIRIAKALEIKATDLIEDELDLPEGAISLKGKMQDIPVIGHVQAGEWQPVSDEIKPAEVTRYVSRIINDKYPHNIQYALEIIGDSMDKLFPEGTHIICININENIPSPESGDLVVVELYAEYGYVETTVKKLALALDGITLIPCSNNPKHKPIVMNDLPEGSSAQIKARVIGAVMEF